MTALQRIAKGSMTVAEFLEWPGDGSATTYELVDGHLRAMAPASATHGTIQANIARLLGNSLLATPCRAVTEAGLVPRMDSAVNVRIPDVTVTCEPPNPKERLIGAPVLIVQVISPSNERDTWEAIWACSTIPSLREIVVVQSEAIDIQVFTRDGNGHWPQTGERYKAGMGVRLEAIEAEIAVADIYDKTGLGKGEAEADE